MKITNMDQPEPELDDHKFSKREIREMISGGESATVEFKRKFTSAEKIARELVAFANTRGGVLIVGVEDNGELFGVESEKGAVQEIETCVVLFIEPQIRFSTQIILIDGIDLLVVRVFESSYKPHWVKMFDDESQKVYKRAFLRKADETVIASKDMVRLLKMQNPSSPALHFEFGDRERRLFQFLELHGDITVKQFADLVNISKRRAGQLLIDLVKVGLVMIHSDLNGSDKYTANESPQEVEKR